MHITYLKFKSWLNEWFFKKYYVHGWDYIYEEYKFTKYSLLIAVKFIFTQIDH